MPLPSIAVLATALLLPAGPSPLSWSPDGRWLAYVQAPTPPIARTGWLFENDGAAPERRAPARRTYKLWASEVASGESALLAAEAGPISAPSWRPTGSAVAYARRVEGEGGRARLEVVVQDGLDRRRVVAVEHLPTGEDLDGLERAAVAWNHDGRYLVVPKAEPAGLAVIQVADGKVVATLDGGFQPAWSPVDSRLAFYRASEGGALYLLEATTGTPRRVAAVPDPTLVPPPAWTRDGRDILVVRPSAATLGANTFPRRFQLSRVEPSGRAEESLAELQPDLTDRRMKFAGAALSLDREGLDFFYFLDFRRPEGQLIWGRLRNNEIRKQFHPLDMSAPIGALASSPKDSLIALRFGAGAAITPPAVTEPRSEALVLLAPDDDARTAWLVTILDTIRAIGRDALPKATLRDKAVERATLLPVPGEIAANDLALIRMRTLARIGRPLCDRPASLPEPSPELRGLLTEAELIFDYVLAVADRNGAGDFRPARASLDRFAPLVQDAAQRRRLLGLRIQILLGQRKFGDARPALDYLKATQPAPLLIVERTGRGPRLVDDPRPRDLWPEFLESSLNQLKAGPVPTLKVDDGVELGNPDAPQPGFGLDVPKAPMPQP